MARPDCCGRSIGPVAPHDLRALFAVDGDNVVRYAEYVPAIGQHPDYDAALAALKDVVG